LDLARGLEIRRKLNGNRFGTTSPVLTKHVPELETLVNEVLFGRIWAREGLDLKSRSIAVIAALTAQGNSKLKNYVANGLNVGLTREEIVEVMVQLVFYVGLPTVSDALEVAHQVFEEEGATAEPPPVPVRFQDIFLHRPFLVLWTAFLISSAGTYLFVIVLAGRIFAETGSALMASSVFAAQWLLPVMLSKVVGRICSSYRIRSVAVMGELLSASVSIACAFAFDLSFASMLACVMLRGFFESLTRTAYGRAQAVCRSALEGPRRCSAPDDLSGTAPCSKPCSPSADVPRSRAVDAGRSWSRRCSTFGIWVAARRSVFGGGIALATFRRYPEPS
jgi:4-carboxymuconolactone decarboxylase